IAQQGRRLVHIHYHHVDVPVVVEIAEGRAAARVWRIHALAALSGHVPKDPAPQVAPEVPEDEARAAIRVLLEMFLDLRIDIPCHEDDIGPSVVVEVWHAGAPADEARLRAEARDHRHIFKAKSALRGPSSDAPGGSPSGAKVAIKDVCVIGEV